MDNKSYKGPEDSGSTGLFPFEAGSQPVVPGSVQIFIVLESSYDNSRGYAELRRKTLNVHRIEPMFFHKFLV